MDEPELPPSGPDRPEPHVLGPHPSVAAVVRHALADSIRRLGAHEGPARAGDDPEAVHQARVATRRLRSDLRTFRPVLDAGWADGLRSELGWIATELGRVRDADVLLADLTARVAALPDPDRAHADALLTRLRDERAEHHGALVDALRSPRYGLLVARLATAGDAPVMATPGHPKRRVRRLARRSWRRLDRTVRELPEGPTDAQLHDVRKRAKDLRYALEAIAPVASRPAVRFADRVRKLQDVLGTQHDAIVAAAWLQRVATTLDDRHTAFAAGLLARGYRDDAVRSRVAWRSAWRRVRRRAPDGFGS